MISPAHVHFLSPALSDRLHLFGLCEALPRDAGRQRTLNHEEVLLEPLLLKDCLLIERALHVMMAVHHVLQCKLGRSDKPCLVFRVATVIFEFETLLNLLGLMCIQIVAIGTGASRILLVEVNNRSGGKIVRRVACWRTGFLRRLLLEPTTITKLTNKLTRREAEGDLIRLEGADSPVGESSDCP